jgi:hypothetical protein
LYYKELGTTCYPLNVKRITDRHQNRLFYRQPHGLQAKPRRPPVRQNYIFNAADSKIIALSDYRILKPFLYYNKKKYMSRKKFAGKEFTCFPAAIGLT